MRREMGFHNLDAEVLMVKWHPRVPSVFLALFSDSTLSVYNPCLQQTPLYSFSVKLDDFVTTPISFAIGSDVGSDAFSLAISYSTGHIALACPLPLPNDSLPVACFRTAWSESDPTLHDWLTHWSVVEGSQLSQPEQTRLVYDGDVQQAETIPLRVVYEPSDKQSLTACEMFSSPCAARLTRSQPVKATVVCLLRFVDSTRCELFLRDLAEPVAVSVVFTARRYP